MLTSFLQLRFFPIRFLAISFLGGLLFFAGAPAVGAAAPQKDKSSPETTVPDQEEERRELRGEEFVSDDGVLLTGSYYPGNAGKDTIPVVLLHGRGQDREEFDPLIPLLKSRGYAIVAPDFRGHGKSTKRYPTQEEIPQAAPQTGMNTGTGIDTVINSRLSKNQQRKAISRLMRADEIKRRYDRTGGFGMGMQGIQAGMQADRDASIGAAENEFFPTPPPQPLEYLAKDFESEDYLNMAMYDCIPFQDFLIYENDQGRLNINKLVIIGVGMGGTIGALWADSDWAQTKTKDTKVLIILSPTADPVIEKVFKNNKYLRDSVSVSLIAGKNDAAAAQLKSLLFGKDKNREEKNDKADNPNVSLVTLETTQKDGELLAAENVSRNIAGMIETKLSKFKEKDLKWKKQ